MAQYTDVAVAPLADKRLQFWAIDLTGKLWSRWKTSTDSNATWTALSTFQMPPGVSVVKSIAAAPLSDGRLQLWTIDSNGTMWSCWKTGDSNSAWTNWTAF